MKRSTVNLELNLDFHILVCSGVGLILLFELFQCILNKTCVLFYCYSSSSWWHGFLLSIVGVVIELAAYKHDIWSFYWLLNLSKIQIHIYFANQHINWFLQQQQKVWIQFISFTTLIFTKNSQLSTITVSLNIHRTFWLCVVLWAESRRGINKQKNNL